MENSARHNRQRAAEFLSIGKMTKNLNSKVEVFRQKERERKGNGGKWDGVDWLSPSKAFSSPLLRHLPCAR